MKRKISSVLGFLTILSALTFGLAAPANASNNWYDYGQTTITAYLQNESRTITFAKVVTEVALFSPSGSTLFTAMTATRANCSIRNMNTSYITGVMVSECAIGIDGNLINNNTIDATDNNGCCANSNSYIRQIKYNSDGYYLRARGTYCWRYAATAILQCQNYLSNPSEPVWLLN